MLQYITKVKLLFLYRFYVLYVLLHYKLLSGDGGRVRPHFYVLEVIVCTVLGMRQNILDSVEEGDRDS